jgi:hypothetical protein
MAGSRYKAPRSSRPSAHSFALDSGVLDEGSVAEALGHKNKRRHGDVIDGVRNGLIVGTGMWIGLFLVVRLFF